MTREEVYKKLINPKRYKQDQQWGGAVHDCRHEIATWLTYMRHYLREAEAKATTSNNDLDTLNEIVNVIALGIACLEYNYPNSEFLETNTWAEKLKP
jgi:hypothetical protein